jgi:two-component sensor histidine kinase
LGIQRPEEPPNEPVQLRLRPRISQKQGRLFQIVVGVSVALVAVGIRYSLPLSPVQIPTLGVVVALAVVTTFVGTSAGIAAAVVGGLLSWYLFFTPSAWELTPQSALPLFAFGVIATVIISTSHLYRRSEQRNHEAQLAAMRRQAAYADLFAREMAHRLKNALAIVQSIAFQTLGDSAADTAKFSARLKALADAHDLLSEHVERPSAKVADVVDAVLQPFDDGGERIRVECADTRIASQHVISLALAIHELGTNASKYGALSSPAGWVSLKIQNAGERIQLEWREFDGPRVVPADATGFGTKLLRRVGSDPELVFHPEGVRCSLYLRKA